jgi:hypothetical protein
VRSRLALLDDCATLLHLRFLLHRHIGHANKYDISLSSGSSLASASMAFAFGRVSRFSSSAAAARDSAFLDYSANRRACRFWFGTSRSTAVSSFFTLALGLVTHRRQSWQWPWAQWGAVWAKFMASAASIGSGQGFSPWCGKKIAASGGREVALGITARGNHY